MNNVSARKLQNEETYQAKKKKKNLTSKSTRTVSTGKKEPGMFVIRQREAFWND